MNDQNLNFRLLNPDRVGDPDGEGVAVVIR